MLGLRYEISSPAGGPTVGNFDLRTLTVNTSSHGGVGFDKKDWAPRVGFAWTVRPKTVIRSGGGIFYAPEGNIFDDLGLNPPALAVLSFNYSSSAIPSPTNQLLRLSRRHSPQLIPTAPRGRYGPPGRSGQPSTCSEDSADIRVELDG